MLYIARIIGISISLVGCGVTGAKYVDYTEAPSSAGGGQTNTECEAGKTAFTENVLPMVSRCTSCHGESGIASASGALLLKNSAEDDRKAIMASSKYPTADTFYTYISSSSHTGQSSVQESDKTALTTWETAENGCG